ncbi:protein NUCLEAR FUSION DEFECTIVE 6, mitochondrial-like [Carex rostrata]
MASMSGARRVLQGLRSSSRSFSIGGARSSAPPSRVSRPMLSSPFSRLPVELGCAQSLMPLHSATATALLTSMLSQKPGTWAWLSEGFAATL